MDTKEFKLFYKNKSPQLYTYLLKELISAHVAEETLSHIFAKYYRIRNHRPAKLTREQWLLMITKKVLVDYYTWRTTEEGQQLQEAGISSYDCSHLMISHQVQLNKWMDGLDEADIKVINETILTELPAPDIRESVQDKVKSKLKEIGDKYGTRKK